MFHRGKRRCLGIDDIEINETPTKKFFRVIIDAKLNWASYITYVKT